MDTATKICLTILAIACVACALVAGICINAEALAVFAGLAGTAIGALGGIAIQNKVNGTSKEV